jgi:branched-subunit amino acid transport protein
MNRMDLWLILLGGLVVTYATRLSFILLVPYERLPAWIRRSLRLVPSAVLAALITPELLLPGGSLDLSLGNERLVAGALAWLVAWRTRSAWLTIACGMLALFILNNL